MTWNFLAAQLKLLWANWCSPQTMHHQSNRSPNLEQAEKLQNSRKSAFLKKSWKKNQRKKKTSLWLVFFSNRFLIVFLFWVLTVLAFIPALATCLDDVNPSAQLLLFLNVCCFYEDAVNKQSAGQVNSLMDPGALGLTQAQIEQIDVASCKSS